MRTSVLDGDVRAAVDQIDPELRAAIGRIARMPILLVACDYDGTLAPIVEDPTRAVPLPESVAAVRALAAEGVAATPTAHGFRMDEGAPRVTASRPFREGWMLIQDETAASVVPFLNVQPGDRVLEVGAAPHQPEGVRALVDLDDLGGLTQVLAPEVDVGPGRDDHPEPARPGRLGLHRRQREVDRSLQVGTHRQHLRLAVVAVLLHAELPAADGQLVRLVAVPPPDGTT
mgnify:CR=1 FL=1